jgi:hypothetical protein
MERRALGSSIGPARERHNEHGLLGRRPGLVPDRGYVICRAADTVIRQG